MKDNTPHTEWCIVRFSHGRFDIVRNGYKSSENARRGIASVSRACIAGGGDRNATYAIGSYTVGSVVVRSAFKRSSAA